MIKLTGIVSHNNVVYCGQACLQVYAYNFICINNYENNQFVIKIISIIIQYNYVNINSAINKIFTYMAK